MNLNLDRLNAAIPADIHDRIAVGVASDGSHVAIGEVGGFPAIAIFPNRTTARIDTDPSPDGQPSVEARSVYERFEAACQPYSVDEVVDLVAVEMFA